VIDKKTAEQVASIINNFLIYSGENDCKIEGEFTQELEDDLGNYMNKIEKGLVQQSLVNGDPVTNVQD